MARLALWFRTFKGSEESSEESFVESVTLERCIFSHPLLEGEQRSVRGKTEGAYTGYGTFQWTPAVQALSILVLRTVALGQGKEGSEEGARLEGGKGSPASSLDYSIGKLPVWLLDVFGVDSKGTPIARRLLKRTNPERKRPGPVAILLNDRCVGVDEIAIFLDEALVSDMNILGELAKAIERNWKSSSSRKVDTKLLDVAVKKVQRSKVEQQIASNGTSCPHCGEHLQMKFVSVPNTTLDLWQSSLVA